jgi:hypothetical protein
MMGSYASQLNVKQRWQVLAYIKQVQSKNGGAPFTLAADGTAATDTTAAAKGAVASKDSTVAKK